MMSLDLQARALSIVKLLVYSLKQFLLLKILENPGKMAQANARLSSSTEGLPGEAKTRYLEKLHLLNGLDSFLLVSKVGPKNDHHPLVIYHQLKLLIWSLS